MPKTNCGERRLGLRRMEDRENYMRLEARFEAFDGRFSRFEQKLDHYMEAQSSALMRLVRIEEQNLQASKRHEDLAASYKQCVVRKEALAVELNELKVRVEKNQTAMKVSERIIWGIGSAIVALTAALMARTKEFG